MHMSSHQHLFSSSTFYRWSWLTTYIKIFAQYPMSASMVLHLHKKLSVQLSVPSMSMMSTLQMLQPFLTNRFDPFSPFLILVGQFLDFHTVNNFYTLKCFFLFVSSMGWLLDQGTTVHSLSIGIWA